MKTSPYWIDAGPTCRLAILSRPRGGDWLADEVASWKRAGLQVIVSMLTTEEVAELDLQDEMRLCSTDGIEFISAPVPDRGVPASLSAFDELVEHLNRRLYVGLSVGVHCRAGVGRSVLLAACVLGSCGFVAHDAIRRIERARGLPVPETLEQRTWIESFASHRPAWRT